MRAEFKTYTLSHPTTKEIRYVGYTSVKLEKRLSEHIKDGKTKRNRKANWIKSLIRSGLKPDINLINTYDTKEEAVFNEINLIFQYRLLGYNLVNSTDGGDGGVGYKFSEEKIKEMAMKRIGKKLGPCSEERKLKISLANKGRKMTEEQIGKMKGRVMKKENKEYFRNLYLGKKLNNETKEKMSIARKREWELGIRKPTRKGMKNSESHKEKMRGEKNPFYGKTHSPEMRELISKRVKEGIAKKRLLQEQAKIMNNES